MFMNQADRIRENIENIKEILKKKYRISRKKILKEINSIELIIRTVDNYLCLPCYIKKNEFVPNYKFPEWIETKITTCSGCLKTKECRLDK